MDKRSTCSNNVGLPNGFIRFGTLAHMILLLMKEYGPQSGFSIREHLENRDFHELRHDKATIGTTLTRLRDNGFIVEVGRARIQEGIRSAVVYFYAPCRPQEFQIKMLTEVERARKYREKIKLKASSVFNFRGKVAIHELNPGRKRTS